MVCLPFYFAINRTSYGLSWAITVCIAVCMGAPSKGFGAVEFENFDEIENAGDDEGQDEPLSLPVIDSEQHDLRQDHRNSIGVSVGESRPHVALGAEYQRTFGPQSAFFLAFGRGGHTTTVQEVGEVTYANRVATTVSDVSYLWWPSQNFPFSVSGNLGWTQVDGVLRGSGVESGHYRLSVIGVGADVQLETFFENGFWLKWMLVSSRFFRVVGGSYSNMTGLRMASARRDFSGAKLVGITNLTFGYSW